MTKKWVLGLAVAAGLAGGSRAARAQYPATGYPTTGGYPGAGYTPGGVGYGSPYPYGPVAPPGGYLPNYYSPANQPLSPYLNMLRGGSPAVNYYYGVRPGTVGGGTPVGGGFGNPAYGMMRPNVLPTTLNPTEEPIEIDPAGVPIRLMPTGHPVTFTGGPGRFGMGAGGNRPGFMRPAAGGTTGTAAPTGTGVSVPRR